MPTTKPELPIKLFKTAAAWDSWLAKNWESSAGIWMRFAKKGGGLRSVSYAEAVEVALCHGWIDSKVKRYDDESYIQKFTPRGRKSIWSKVNCQKAEALIRDDRMRPGGHAAIASAKADGRWEAAYDSPKTATVPADLQAALDAHPKAKAFFQTVSSQNRYAILFRLQTAAKADTRRKRIVQFVEMLERRETFHS